MDILNWLYLVKNKFTRTTVETPATDLILLGADVGFQKRGDKYQNYVMTVEDFGLSLGVNPQFISTTDGTNVTGVTVVTKSASVLIPANTVKVGDSVFIRTRGRKVGTNAISAQSIYINPTDVIGGSPITLNAIPNTSLYSQISRTLVVKSATVTETISINTGGVDDDATTSNAVSNWNIDWTKDQYIIFGFTNISAADATRTSYYEVTINKG
jgi:hypothetical protein